MRTLCDVGFLPCRIDVFVLMSATSASRVAAQAVREGWRQATPAASRRRRRCDRVGPRHGLQQTCSPRVLVLEY